MAEPRVSTNYVATVLGRGWRITRKVLDRQLVYRPDQHGLYDARVLDLVRAMHDQPHRALEPVASDWLARYLREK